ncbi:MAG: hypothetical protein AAF494_03220 [Pseudomonadota bacterium]
MRTTSLVTLGLALTALWSSSLVAQVVKDQPNVEEVARTPLEDLGINADEIPEVLAIATKDPYASEKLETCNAIVGEIAALDQVLGPDYDLAGEANTGFSVGTAAKGVVGSFIPFRGLVREVSGAAGDERKTRAAVAARMVRRGFLKGLGQQRGCAYPARPRPERLDQEP